MNIKELYIDDLSEIADLMYEDALNLDDIGSVTAFGYYDDIAILLKELLQYDDTSVGNIELHEETLHNYSDIFALTITNELEIWSEPMLVDGKYLGYEAEKVYIADDCTTAILKKNDNEDAPIFSFGYGVESDNCCDNCDCYKEESAVSLGDKNDEKPVATSAKESYFINGKSVDKSEFDKKYEEFEEMYLDNIRDMLLGYCEFMDEVNEWRSRFLRW